MNIKDLLKAGESQTLEYKPLLRAQDWRGNPRAKKDVEINILKSIAGFLNAEGGKLIVGVDDYGKPNDKLLEGFKVEH